MICCFEVLRFLFWCWYGWSEVIIFLYDFKVSVTLKRNTGFLNWCRAKCIGTLFSSTRWNVLLITFLDYSKSFRKGKIPSTLFTVQWQTNDWSSFLKKSCLIYRQLKNNFHDQSSADFHTGWRTFVFTLTCGNNNLYK